MIALNPFGAFFKGAAAQAGDAIIGAGTKFCHTPTFKAICDLDSFARFGAKESAIKNPEKVVELFARVEDAVGLGQTATNLPHFGIADAVELGVGFSAVKSGLPLVLEHADLASRLGKEAYLGMMKQAVTEPVRDAISIFAKVNK